MLSGIPSKPFSAAYTRKYLGLSQAKARIETFPYLELTPEGQKTLCQLVSARDAEGVVKYLNRHREEFSLCPR